MAWNFVRLKARLMANGLRGGTQRVLGTVVGAIYGALLAIGGFALLAAAGSHPTDGPTIAMLAATVLVVGWAAVPVLGFGSDETLDPSRLELLPLSRRDKMAGLLAASLVGIGPIATLIALSGAVAGFAPLGLGGLLVAVAAAMQLVMCLALARALVTAMSAWLRSRRGRDLRVLLVPLVVLVPELLRLVYLPKHASLASLRPLAKGVAWVPALFPMRALVAASQGRILEASVSLVGGAATVVVICWWWARTLERIATSAEVPNARSKTGATRTASDATADTSIVASRASLADRAGASRRSDPLFGLVLAWLPRTRTGAVAAREFRTSWRDPRRRVQTISTVLLPFILLAGVLAKGASGRPALVYAALLAIGLGGARVNNQLGLDGRAWWLHEAGGADWRRDLTGKNIGLAVTSLPIAIVAAVVLAALSGGWTQLPAVVLLAIGLEGAQLAIGNVVSVRAPWAVPDSKSNAFAAKSGQGCFVGLVTLLALFVLGALSLPGIVAVSLVPSAVGRVVVGLGAVAYGYGLWRLGLSWAVAVGNRRGPEILSALNADAGAR